MSSKSRCYAQGEARALRYNKTLLRLGASLLLLTALYAVERDKPMPFREYPGDEYRVTQIPLPPDFAEKTEWVFARLMYPSIPDAHFRHAGWDWTQGHASWTNDYPRSDRHFVQAVRRLTGYRFDLLNSLSIWTTGTTYSITPGSTPSS